MRPSLRQRFRRQSRKSKGKRPSDGRERKDEFKEPRLPCPFIWADASPAPKYRKVVYSYHHETRGDAAAVATADTRDFFFVEREGYVDPACKSPRRIPRLISSHPSLEDAKWHLQEHLDSLAGRSSEKAWFSRRKDDLTWSVRWEGNHTVQDEAKSRKSTTNPKEENDVKGSMLEIEGFDIRLIKARGESEFEAWNTRLRRWRESGSMTPMASIEEWASQEAEARRVVMFVSCANVNSDGQTREGREEKDKKRHGSIALSFLVDPLQKRMRRSSFSLHSPISSTDDTPLLSENDASPSSSLPGTARTSLNSNISNVCVKSVRIKQNDDCGGRGKGFRESALEHFLRSVGFIW